MIEIRARFSYGDDGYSLVPDDTTVTSYEDGPGIKWVAYNPYKGRLVVTASEPFVLAGHEDTEGDVYVVLEHPGCGTYAEEAR